MPMVSPLRAFAASSLAIVTSMANAEDAHYPATDETKSLPMAHAIVNVAGAARELDLQAIGREFGVPDLAKVARWDGPPAYRARREQVFRATYRPETSPNGLRAIDVQWSVMTREAPVGLRAALTVTLDPSACPTNAMLELTTGVKARLLVDTPPPAAQPASGAAQAVSDGPYEYDFNGPDGARASVSIEREYLHKQDCRLSATRYYLP
jgi:hypothetical protein